MGSYFGFVLNNPQRLITDRVRTRVESAMLKRLSLPTVTEHFPRSRPAVTGGGQTPHEHTSDSPQRERARDALWQRRSRGARRQGALRPAREFLPRDPRLCLAQLGNIPSRPPSMQRKEPSCPQGSVSPMAPAHPSPTTPTS